MKSAKRIAHVSKDYQEYCLNKTAWVVVCKAYIANLSAPGNSQGIESLEGDCSRMDEATLIMKGELTPQTRTLESAAPKITSEGAERKV